MPGKVVKDSSRKKIPEKVLNGAAKKISSMVAVKKPQSSQLLIKHVLSALNDQEKTVKQEEPSNILFELIKNIFTGDEVSIKDSYSTLVAYFILNANDVSYDLFSGTYESAKISYEPKHAVCCILPYGGLIASGLILKWRQEHQTQIVFKMLKIHQIQPECEKIIFHFLLALDKCVKLGDIRSRCSPTHSLVHLYFLLSVDSKQDITANEPMFSPDNILELIDVLLKKNQDLELCEKTSELIAKKLLSFGSPVLLNFWHKLMQVCSDCKNDFKDLIVLQLLSSVLSNCSEHDILLQLDKLITPCLVKILSKSSPKIEPVFKTINLSLQKLSKDIGGSIKLSIIETILVNTPKYVDRSYVTKVCESLVGNMSFEEVSHVVELYRQVIEGEKHKHRTAVAGGDGSFNDFEKISCVRFLGKLMSLSICKDQLDWRKTHFKLLFKIGFLSEYKDTVGPELAGVSRKIFFSSLNQKFAKLIDLDNILKKMVKTAGERVSETGDNFVVPFKKSAYDLWFKTLNTLNRLKESETEDKLVFKVLLRYMMLLLFSDYPTAKTLLEEVFKIIEFKESTSEELHWSEVTVDMFLQLLSGKDNAHSNVIRSTFSHVCKHMTTRGLHLILSAVKGEENDIKDLSRASDSSGCDEESMNSEQDEDENESEESEDDDTEENLGQIDKLKDALREELYKIDTASTCGSVDLDDLDEEEGKQLNSTLGQIFKAQSTKFKSLTNNKANNLEMHFRVRAVSLLEIFIDNELSLNNALVILSNIIPLLKISIPNHVLTPFVVSLKKCLKKLTNLKQFPQTDVTEASICSAFNEVLVRDCPPSVCQDMMEQIVDSCLFLIRATNFTSESNGEMSVCLKKVVKGYFKDVENHVPFLLFTSIYSSLSLDKLLPLTKSLLKFVFSNEIKQHKRTQALQLLITFYNNNRLFKDVGTFDKSLVDLEQAILDKSFDFISKVEPTEIHKKYGCMFLDLLALVKSKNKSLTTEPGPHWDNLTKIIDRLSSIGIFQNELNISFVKFCKICNHNIENTTSSSNNKKKRKIDSSGVDKQTAPLKNKKSKK